MGEAATRIVFAPYTHPDGQTQTFPDDVCAEGESIQFDNGWLHVVRYDSGPVASNRRPLRSYPAHVVEVVRHG